MFTVSKSVDLGEDGSVVIKMAASASHQSAALLTDRGRLWLGSADLRSNYRLVDVRHLNIKQIAWLAHKYFF